jgi:hypothetical protein
MSVEFKVLSFTLVTICFQNKSMSNHRRYFLNNFKFFIFSCIFNFFGELLKISIVLVCNRISFLFLNIQVKDLRECRSVGNKKLFPSISQESVLT